MPDFTAIVRFLLILAIALGWVLATAHTRKP
jgi:hypothetical protein